MMKHFSLDTLRAFTAVVELQSFTLAAEQLSRSQPAISLQLKRLEDFVGQPLIQRTGHTIKLTLAGQELYRGAIQLLGQHDKLLAKFRTKPIRGQVRLGIPSEFATVLLPRILGQFANNYPEITLEVTSGLSRELREKASLGLFDVILTVAEEAPPQSILVKEDELLWIYGQVDLLDTSPIPLVLASEGCIYRTRALHVLKENDIAARITYTNNDLTGIASALNSGLGITVLARSSLPKNLREYKPTMPLPYLGSINIYLERHGQLNNTAADHLQNYLFDFLSLSH